MKKLHSLMIAAWCCTLFTGCEEEYNLSPTADFSLQAAEITAPAANSSFVLDVENQDEVIRFEWNAASNDQGFLITYNLVMALPGGDFSDPFISQVSDNNGAGLSATLSHARLDQVLADLGVAPEEEAQVIWAVEAISLNQKQLSSPAQIILRRFVELIPSQLFISGEATEVGNDVANAIQMVSLKDAGGARLNIFEVYTSLEAGSTFRFFTKQEEDSRSFGGNGGELVEDGADIITPSETGQYRIRVDMNNSTLEFMKIDKWSIVGNVIENGWGGDEPLDYQGGGVWSRTITLVDADPGDSNKRFIFRANEDWGIVIKQVRDGENNAVLLESFANEIGVTVEDISVSDITAVTIVLDLSAPSPSFSVE